jgi:hypothetical protein
MKNTIFAIRGKSNIGKTTTIKIIYDLLKSKYPNAIIEELIIAVDIKVIITINNIKIGIESQGDPNGRLEKSLKYFVDSKCNIIVCGARTRGMTNDWIKKYSKQFAIKWISKSISSNRNNEEIDNKNQANEIVKSIESLLK